MKKRVFAVFTILTVFACSASVNALYDLKLTDWRGISYSNIEKYNDCYVYVDTREHHGGKAALHVSYYEGWTSNHYLMLQLDGFSVSTEKEYMLSYWHKGKDISATPLWLWDWTGLCYPPVPTEEWTYVEQKIKPSSNNFMLNLEFSNITPDYWIDDICLTEIGGNGENLVYNGDFESCPLVKPDKVTDAKITKWKDSLELEWKNPSSDDFAGINIYRLENGEETLVYSDDSGKVERTEFKELAEEELYQYVIYAVSKYGVESDGVLLFEETDAKQITASNINVSFTAGRKIAKAEIKNNTNEDNKKMTLVMTVWEDGIMKGMKTSEKTFSKGQSQTFTSIVSNVTENANVELYLCDDLNNILPLTDIIYED